MKYALEQLESLLDTAQHDCHEHLQDANGFSKDGNRYMAGYSLGRSDAYALMAEEIKHLIAGLEVQPLD